MTLNDVFNALGSTVILPLFIFIFAVCLKVKVKDAFKSALFIGVALVGINMVVGFFTSQITGPVNLMVENSGVNLPFIDVGWGAAAAIAYGSRVGLMIIPVAIVVNIIMLAVNMTDTLNIDIWNYWHYAFVGALAATFTNNVWMGFLAAIILEMFSLLFADWSQASAQQYYGYEGVSFTTISSVEYVPYAVIVNKLLDLIGLNKVQLNPETIKKRMSVFGEPAVLGLVIGLFIAICGYWNQLGSFESWAVILATGITTAAIMHIFPLMPRILMNGLMPISKSIREVFNKRGMKRQIYFGMDTALCVGETATLATSLILIPICLILMFALPYNKFLWIADLVGFPWFVAMMTPITKGNILKNVIIGASYLCIGNWIITSITPMFTQVAISSGWAVDAGMQGIGAGSEGISYIHYLISHAMSSPITIVVVVAVYAVCLFFFKKNKLAWQKAAGYVPESEPVHSK